MNPVPDLRLLGSERAISAALKGTLRAGIDDINLLFCFRELRLKLGEFFRSCVRPLRLFDKITMRAPNTSGNHQFPQEDRELLNLSGQNSSPIPQFHDAGRLASG